MPENGANDLRRCLPGSRERIVAVALGEGYKRTASSRRHSVAIPANVYGTYIGTAAAAVASGRWSNV
ncbi:MAG: hypothetical protein U0841_16915 [Chloroflexia bacterium]